jgi:guanosine-3',5'-bis(diphosphate) 3'-pyrophosphohydrolase
MSLATLIASLPDTYTDSDKELVTRAYHFAEKAHLHQKRASGDPYITHCEAVAAILAEMRVPPVVVVAGLLHDTVEDTEVTLDDIRKEFGDETAKLVDGVTKLTQLPRVSRAEQNIQEKPGAPTKISSKAEPEPVSNPKSRRKDLTNETLRKTFLAMGDDIRVVLIKLADRLHNMRTLSYMPESSRKKIARETLDIFAPLANRLGIWQMKWELEDLSFRYVNPVKYKDIAEKLSERRDDRETKISSIIKHLSKILAEANIKAEISGRPKHIYSIYRKMQEKDKIFEDLVDIRGVRLIVADIPTCYAALGIIHTHWRPIPNTFDDYIAAPKDNFYQSLHSAVIYDDKKSLEIQIRTPEMHQNAEYGIAAHWRYKEKGPRDDIFEERVNWLRQLMDWHQDVNDAQEFVDSMKTDVFKDRVYVFTPKGDVIDLPSGSTPIDFAYHVHTEIGNRCRGAKVNGKLVTLDHALVTGDRVEILTAKQGGPSRDWLNPNLGLVKTQRARSKIRAWFKYENREQNLSQGKLLFDKELHRLGLSNINLENLAASFEIKSVEDFYVALGSGDLTLGRVVNKLSEDEEKKEELVLAVKPGVEKIQEGDAISVLGLKGILTNIARCCNPVPGDEIVGYITRGRGATIHRYDCPNVMRMKDRERIVKVSWGEPQHTYPIPVQIKAYDRQGLMGDITTILSNESINLTDINSLVSHNLATINMVLEIGDISQLSRVLTKIENLPNVMEARRAKPG